MADPFNKTTINLFDWCILRIFIEIKWESLPAHRQSTVVSQGRTEGASHLTNLLLRNALLGFTVFVVYHFDDFRLITVGEQIMRGIDVLKTLLIVLSSLIVNPFIFLLHLHWINRHSIDQLLSISCAIFREVHIHKASQGVSVSSQSYIPVLISHSKDHLLLKSLPLIPFTSKSRVLGIDCVVTHNSISFPGIKLLYSRLLLLLNSSMIIFFQFSDVIVMFLLKLQVFLHNTMHVRFIHIHINHFFSLLQGLIFIL